MNVLSDVFGRILGYVIFFGILIGITALVSNNKKKKLKEAGLTGQQDGDFTQWIYSYRLRPVSCEIICEYLNALDLANMKLPNVQVSYDAPQNRINIHDDSNMNKWDAVLDQTESDESHCKYEFHFTSWPTSVPFTMLIFHTALEKMFLEIDWDTVTEKRILDSSFKNSTFGVTAGRREAVDK